MLINVNYVNYVKTYISKEHFCLNSIPNKCERIGLLNYFDTTIVSLVHWKY